VLNFHPLFNRRRYGVDYINLIPTRARRPVPLEPLKGGDFGEGRRADLTMGERAARAGPPERRCKYLDGLLRAERGCCSNRNPPGNLSPRVSGETRRSRLLDHTRAFNFSAPADSRQYCFAVRFSGQRSVRDTAVSLPPPPRVSARNQKDTRVTRLCIPADAPLRASIRRDRDVYPLTRVKQTRTSTFERIRITVTWRGTETSR